MIHLARDLANPHSRPAVICVLCFVADVRTAQNFKIRTDGRTDVRTDGRQHV